MSSSCCGMELRRCTYTLLRLWVAVPTTGASNCFCGRAVAANKTEKKKSGIHQADSLHYNISSMLGKGACCLRADSDEPAVACLASFSNPDGWSEKWSWLRFQFMQTSWEEAGVTEKKVITYTRCRV